jgi:hypothetical protein
VQRQKLVSPSEGDAGCAGQIELQVDQVTRYEIVYGQNDIAGSEAGNREE